MKFLLVFRLEKQPWKHFLCPEHSINTFLGITTHGALSAFTFVFSLCFLIVLLPLLHTCICFLCIHTIQSIYFAHSFFQTLYIVTFILSHSVVLFCVIYSFIYIILHKFPIKSCSPLLIFCPSLFIWILLCPAVFDRAEPDRAAKWPGRSPQRLWPVFVSLWFSVTSGHKGSSQSPAACADPAHQQRMEWEKRAGYRGGRVRGDTVCVCLCVSESVSVNTLDEPSALLLLL